MVRVIDFVQRNSRFYIVLTGVLVANIALFLTGAYREVRLYRDSAQVLRETSARVRKARREREQAAEIAGNVGDVRKRINSFFNEELQPSGAELPDLTRQLYEILATNHMEFQHITYTRKSELNGRLTRVVVHVPVKASYPDLRALLTDLEGLAFPTMVDRISVSSAMGREVNATIDIVSYFREQ